MCALRLERTVLVACWTRGRPAKAAASTGITFTIFNQDGSIRASHTFDTFTWADTYAGGHLRAAVAAFHRSLFLYDSSRRVGTFFNHVRSTDDGDSSALLWGYGWQIKVKLSDGSTVTYEKD